MPKERVVAYIPNHRLTGNLCGEMGLNKSKLGEHIASLRELIQKLRHSIAHFDINIISDDEKHLIDWLEFRDSQQQNKLVASFKAQELLPFLKYYSNCLLENMRKHRE